MRHLACLLLLACADPPPPASEAIPGAAHLRLLADPALADQERPPVKTLWAKAPDGRWRAEARVTQVAPGGAWQVDAARNLVHGGRIVADAVLPDLRVAADGVAWITRSTAPPASDIWRVAPDGTLARHTTDGRSDRPFPLPDGRLLWVSGEGGVAGFVLDGARLTNRRGDPFVPVPAHPAKSRLEGDRFVFDAGDDEWWLDLNTGAAGPR